MTTTLVLILIALSLISFVTVLILIKGKILGYCPHCHLERKTGLVGKVFRICRADLYTPERGEYTCPRWISPWTIEYPSYEKWRKIVLWVATVAFILCTSLPFFI
ncbi:hypothetical protein HN803_01765 [candidate division WWE3 bacterium]|jgi:hypothetical protein|nr:hypothetical protein [candidate division WWE3 bacterium]MBT7349498.1 hypothetical protein [candidate division WWE3 bacterium]